MHILIITGGVVGHGITTEKILKQNFDLIISADSGAKTALEIGFTTDIIVGDLDSIDKKNLNEIVTPRPNGTCNDGEKPEIIKFSKEKNETDTELAITEAIKRGATEITIIGGSEGDRLDHILANIFLLNLYPNTQIRFVNRNQIIWLAIGPKNIKIKGNIGDLLSLIPLNGNAEGITTDGLQYCLKNETLFFGKPKGISNIFTKNEANIKIDKGSLLFIHTTQ